MMSKKYHILFGFFIIFICATPIFAEVDTSSECSHLRGWRSVYIAPGDTAGSQQQYDSLKKYIELCPYDAGAGHAFSAMSGDLGWNGSTDISRYDRFREWLISVLSLNKTDSFYFCADIEAIMDTYALDDATDTIPHLANASLAIAEFLMTIPYCNSPGLQDFINNTIRSRHDTWLDDTTKKEDTTLPTMNQLGLGFLVKSSVESPGIILDNSLSSFTSSPNPFLKETTLEFTLNRMTYIMLTIYDELGRLVWGDSRGSSLEAGIHTIQIDGNNLPSGTLYARISTGFGEVKTVKLVHEK